MKFSQEAQLYFEALMRLIYPASCGLCGGMLDLNERGVCTGCHGKITRLRRTPDAVLLDQKFRGLNHVWALYPYEGPVQDLLTSVKFGKKRWLLDIFRDELAETAEQMSSESHYDAIIPIPLSREKILEREFNQSDILAGMLRRRTGIPVWHRAFSKMDHVPQQSLLSKKERELNPVGAFKLRKRFNMTGKNFLLVDDIVTTGSTAREAARMLKENGAKRVDLFALAAKELA